MSLLDILMPRTVRTVGARLVAFHTHEFLRDEEERREQKRARWREEYRKNAEKRNKKAKEYYLKNRERCLELGRLWREKYRDRERKKNRERMRRKRAEARGQCPS